MKVFSQFICQGRIHNAVVSAVFRSYISHNRMLSEVSFCFRSFFMLLVQLLNAPYSHNHTNLEYMFCMRYKQSLKDIMNISSEYFRTSFFHCAKKWLALLAWICLRMLRLVHIFQHSTIQHDVFFSQTTFVTWPKVLITMQPRFLDARRYISRWGLHDVFFSQTTFVT